MIKMNNQYGDNLLLLQCEIVPCMNSMNIEYSMNIANHEKVQCTYYICFGNRFRKLTPYGAF